MSSYAYWRQWSKVEIDSMHGIEPEEHVEEECEEEDNNGGLYLMDSIEWDWRDFF